MDATIFKGLAKGTVVRVRGMGKHGAGKISVDVPAEAGPDAMVRFRSKYDGGEHLVRLGDVTPC